MSIKLTINGKEYEVPEGLNVLRACGRVGIKVPHFCYHPGLGPDGNCRMCQVEIETPRGMQLVISCNTPATDGLVVHTETERVKEARASVEEMLLLNHPLDCPICDKAGECTLQDYYMEHDREDSFQEFTREKKKKAIVIGETLVLDQERCVLCDRCVKFLRDKAKKEQLYIAGRGHHSYLTPFPGYEVDSPYSLNTVDLCPVGALTSRDFRFSAPVWMLKTTPSVCTSCARGCGIRIDHRDGKIARLRPRYNPNVNDYWICDEGRLNYRFVNEDRVTAPAVVRDGKEVETSYEQVLEEIRSLIGNRGTGRGTVLLASANSTVEELFALQQLSKKCLNGAPLYAVRHVPDGIEDDFLKRSDRHANAMGAELLSIPVLDLKKDGEGNDESIVEDHLTSGGIVLTVGFDTCVESRLLGLLDHAGTVIALAARRNGITERARVVVPTMTFAEKEGTVVNFERRAQALHPANVGNAYVPEGFDVKSNGVSQWKVISDLIELCEKGKGYRDLAQLRGDIKSSVPAFSEADLDNLGSEGMVLDR